MPVIESPIRVSLDQIIFATDFLPASEKALSYVEGLAKNFSSVVTVDHIVDLSVATRSEAALVGYPIEEMRESGAAGLRRVSEQLRKSGITVRSKMAEAFTPGSAIVDLSTEMDADLIVVGTNARHGVNKWIMGSTAEGVIHHAKCPVLTIGPKAKNLETHYLSPKRILFATELEHHAAEKAAAAIAFAEGSIGTIYLAHVVTENVAPSIHQRLRAKVEAELRRYIPNTAYEWCSPRALVDFGKPAERILHWAKEYDVNLIVLGSHRDSTWYTHLSGGVIGEVVASSEAPVLTICTN